MSKLRGDVASRRLDRTRRNGGVVADVIGSKLQELYSALSDEPVPERFIELLKKLEQRDTQ